MFWLKQVRLAWEKELDLRPHPSLSSLFLLSPYLVPAGLSTCGLSSRSLAHDEVVQAHSLTSLSFILVIYSSKCMQHLLGTRHWSSCWGYSCGQRW